MAQIARPACSRCSGDTVLRRQIIADGTFQFAWWCKDCARWAERPPQWLPHAALRERLTRQGVDFASIPLVADYSQLAPCVICGKPGQEHHWAPQCLESVFGEDWHLWPTAYLCLKHHTLWHKLVTPHLGQHKGD